MEDKKAVVRAEMVSQGKVKIELWKAYSNALPYDYDTQLYILGRLKLQTLVIDDLYDKLITI